MALSQPRLTGVPALHARAATERQVRSRRPKAAPVPDAPCEDSRPAAPAATATAERALLAAHRRFRAEVRAAFISILLIACVFAGAAWAAPSVLPGEPAPSALTGLALALCAVLLAGADLTVWLIGAHIVERRFSLIAQHSHVAGRGLFIDDPARGPDAVAVLLQTWSYQTVLIRWLRDLRLVVTGAGAVLAGAGIGYASLPSGRMAVLAMAVLVLQAGMAWAFATRLIGRATSEENLDPTALLRTRIESLIDEVRDLRRGREGRI